MGSQPVERSLAGSQRARRVSDARAASRQTSVSNRDVIMMQSSSGSSAITGDQLVMIVVSERSGRARVREVHERSAGRLSAAPLSRCNHDAITIRLMSHQWHSASDELIRGRYAGDRRAQQASEARAASRQPLGELSRCNHDAITIRLMRHQWHSASDELVSRRSTRAAGDRSAGRLSAAPR